MLWPKPQRTTQFRGPRFLLRSDGAEVYFAPHSSIDETKTDWLWDYFQ